MPTLTDEIRQRLVALGLSQTDLADRTGVSQQVLSKFIAGGPVRSPTLDLLAEFLRIELKQPRKQRGA